MRRVRFVSSYNRHDHRRGGMTRLAPENSTMFCHVQQRARSPMTAPGQSSTLDVSKASAAGDAYPDTFLDTSDGSSAELEGNEVNWLTAMRVDGFYHGGAGVCVVQV